MLIGYLLAPNYCMGIQASIFMLIGYLLAPNYCMGIQARHKTSVIY
jgi:hypothetical protein